jgi:hypothetical protein
MSYRYRVSTVAWVAVIGSVIALALLLPVHAAGQAQSSSPKAKAASKQWTAPRTPDGQPDLEGYWTNATTTPLERPAFLAGKQVLTAEEAAEFQKRVLTPSGEGPPGLQAGSSIDASWFERGNVVEGRRTSLIVDPPDGKIPPLTPAAQQRATARAQQARLHPADGPENRSLGERCLVQASAGPPMLPGGYNNNYQIVQGPGYVAILVEMLHEVRIIPLDGRPHLPSAVRHWLGDSRGRWEGNTLVVDTTNFTGKTAFRGSGENLHLVERFTRTDAETIRYEFTVDDPATFTKPWSAELPMHPGQGPIYEYACNEGNYALVDILNGARADEQRAAEAPKRESK